MIRDVEKIKQFDPNWQDHCFNGNLGEYGEFYIGDDGQSVLDNNAPPPSQPGLWCQWEIVPVNKEDANKEEFYAYLQWDQGEKFYHYIEWLKYLISKFFAPSGIFLYGITLAIGEKPGDAKYIATWEYEVYLFDALDYRTNEIITQMYGHDSDFMGIFNKIKKTPKELGIDEINNNEFPYFY